MEEVNMRPVLTCHSKFFGKFEIDANGCWNWNGGVQHGGYGMGHARNKTIAAHRLSYELHIGKIPEGLCVLHRCDNPPCVNPNHLFLGTHQDNIDDKILKERQYKGVHHHRAKLTEEEIKAIRAEPNYRGVTAILSKRFGVTDVNICDIRSRKTWKHIP